jgi:hypothetical protein
MFNKKKCKRCGNKVEKKDSFCSSCGLILKEFDEGEWGMLGKNDTIMPEINMPGFGMIFNSLMKNFGSQIKEMEKELKNGLEKNPNALKRGISISISTSGNNPPKIKINDLSGNIINAPCKEAPVIKKKVGSLFLSEEKAKKFLELPQEEPQTKIRRLSDKMVYEIELPGVKSLNDVSIMQLENSIELKAVSKKKSYKKVIPINFPIQRYKLSNEKMILELGVKNR